MKGAVYSVFGKATGLSHCLSKFLDQTRAEIVLTSLNDHTLALFFYAAVPVAVAVLIAHTGLYKSKFELLVGLRWP